MKICDIENFKDVIKYCKYKECKSQDMSKCDLNFITPSPTSPSPKPIEELLHTSYKWHNNSNSIGYTLFACKMIIKRAVTIIGILYSYDTPIGLITDSQNIVILESKNKFSPTTTKILNHFNKFCPKLSRYSLKKIIKALGLKGDRL